MHTKCSIYKAMSFIGKKWSLLILLELYKINGMRRYSALKRAMPEITGKMLSARLKELEKEGLITRKVEANPEIISKYSLTESGKELVDIVKRVKKWSDKWKHGRCDDKDCRDCEI
ncbi:MAG: helix-turn-helix transcriptional regulator [Candidatus Aenigmarchaeota archaeon]|nr:helix-turn-helix transcriptional regulator [Candidatus Aenigmarchaeota archaeon]